MYHIRENQTTRNPSNINAWNAVELHRRRGAIGLSKRNKHMKHAMDAKPDARGIYQHVEGGGWIVMRPQSLRASCIDLDAGEPDAISVLCETYSIPYHVVRTENGKWHVWVMANLRGGGNPRFESTHCSGEIFTTRPIIVYNPGHVLRVTEQEPVDATALWRVLLKNPGHGRDYQESLRDRCYEPGNRHSKLNADLWYAILQGRSIDKFLALAEAAGVTPLRRGSILRATSAAAERKLARCARTVDDHFKGHENAARVLAVMLAHVPWGDGFCWASQRNIGRGAGISRPKANGWIDKLHRKGFLKQVGFVEIGQAKPLIMWDVLPQRKGQGQ